MRTGSSETSVTETVVCAWNSLHLQTCTVWSSLLMRSGIICNIMCMLLHFFSDCISEEGNAISSICPCFSTLSFEPRGFDLDILHVWVMTIVTLRLKVKVRSQNAVGGTSSEGSSCLDTT